MRCDNYVRESWQQVSKYSARVSLQCVQVDDMTKFRRDLAFKIV